MINRKSRDEIKRMRHAGHIVALVHQKMKEVVEPGISTKELDNIAMKVIYPIWKSILWIDLISNIVIFINEGDSK